MSDDMDPDDIDETLAFIEDQGIEELARAKANAFEVNNKKQKVERAIRNASNAADRQNLTAAVNFRTIQILAEQKQAEMKAKEARRKMRETPLHERPAGLTRAGRSYSDRSDRSDSSNDSKVIIF